MADLLAFVDVQTQTHTTQQANLTLNNNSESAPGVFEALMTEYTTPEELELDLNLTLENAKPFRNEEFFLGDSMTAFKGGNLFSGSFMGMLKEMKTLENSEPLLNNFSETDEVKNLFAALKNSLHEIKNNLEQTEVFYSDDDLVFNEKISELFNMTDEELNAKLNSLPEETKAEIKNLMQEIINALENGNEDIKSEIAKLSGLLNKNEVKTQAKISKSNSEKSETESESEIKEKNNRHIGQEQGQKLENNFADNAGVAAVQNVNVDKNERDFSIDENENQNQHSKKIPQTLRQNSRPTHEINNAPAEIKTENNSESSKPENNFNKILENNETPEQNNFSDGESENRNQNFNQAREIFSDNRNSSRPRNDAQKISNENSRAQNEREFTNSHNNFQSFFEGVLNNRRVSTTSPQPLNIRENFNLNQSETLRNGVVNVVRFIRADGVRKANVVIDPPALGRISVELSSTTSGVEASIKVASEQIRQLVQDQLSQLRMNLSEQGVQVAEFTVDVQQDSQQNSRNSQQQNQNNELNFIGGVDDEEDTEDFRIDLNEGLLYWVA